MFLQYSVLCESIIIEYSNLEMETNITETEPFRSKRSVAKLPKVVYPEFLVLADFATFQLDKEFIITIANYSNHYSSIMYNMCSDTGFKEKTWIIFWNIY